MDQSLNPFDKSEIDKIKEDLAEQILLAMEKNLVTMPQSKDIANYILDQMKKVTNYQELTLLLDDLRNKWVFFTNTHTIYKNKVQSEQEKKIIDKLGNYLKTVG